MQTHVDDEKMAVSFFLVWREGKADVQVVFLYKLIAGVAESSHGTRKSPIQ